MAHLPLDVIGVIGSFSHNAERVALGLPTRKVNSCPTFVATMSRLHEERTHVIHLFGHYNIPLNDRMEYVLHCGNYGARYVGIRYSNYGKDTDYEYESSYAEFEILLDDDTSGYKTYKAGSMYCNYTNTEDALRAFLHEDGHWVWSPIG
jgi:hypothetical protein